MKLGRFHSQYFYIESQALGEIRTLTLSDSPMRKVQLPYLPFTFVLDRILGVQISPPALPAGFSQDEFNQYMTSIGERITKILSKILEFRKDYYVTKHIYPSRFCSEDNDPRLAIVEREFFLTQKLSKWSKEKLSYVLNTPYSKKSWLNQIQGNKNNFCRALTVRDDYKNPVLYYLQELYRSYSLEEEMFTVGHALERLSLPGIRVFKNCYDLVISDDAYSASALDLEVAFRTQFLKAVYASLVSQQLPNTTDLEAVFRAFYLHAVKWTLIKTLRNHPDLQEPFSQIPAECPFWEETELNKDWWDFIVKTLNPRICVYTVSPSQQPSAQ